MSKKPEPLDDETMRELGWKAVWPMGNPKEPWWEKEGYQTFFHKPTAEELLRAIREQAAVAAVTKLQARLNRCLTINYGWLELKDEED